MNVSFEGAHETIVTMTTASASINPQNPVKLNGDGNVTNAALNDVAIGIALQKPAGGIVPVQIGGYIRVRYSGTAPGVGFQSLVADGMGSMASAATGGRTYLVLDVDTANKWIGIMI